MLANGSQLRAQAAREEKERLQDPQVARAELGAILRHLPEEWQIVETNCHTLECEPVEPDGRRLYFGFGRYNQTDRWSVSGKWPRTKENHNWQPHADESVDSISVARGRDAKAAAADIQRRYIEPYTAIWPVCAARARAFDQRQDRQLATLRRLVSIVDPDFEAKERKRVAEGHSPLIARGCHNHHVYARGIRKIDVCSEGLVQIETDHRLSPALAEKILRLIAAEFTVKGEDDE